MRNRIQQQITIDYPHTHPAEIFQEAVEISTAITQTPTGTIEGQPRRKNKLDLIRRYLEQVGCRLGHAERVHDQVVRVIGMEDHTSIFTWDDAWEQPAFMGIFGQKGAQIDFSWNGHVGQDRFD